MILFFYLFAFMVLVNACEQHQTCRACIRDNGACVWCAKEKINGSRCISEKVMPPNWCPDELQNPTSSIIPHQPEFNPAQEKSEETYQLNPQKIDMKLRPGQTINFEFSFNAISHYPIDLYFLYDASISPESRRKHVEITTQAIKVIQNVTNNVYVGFGSFTNKNLLPFTSIKNETSSYSFRHRFSLSENHKGFKTALDNEEIVNSPFIDNWNGGFDALAQVMACKEKEIGWRKISRKIVIFFSDNLYNAAGDGKAAGIFNPYDGGCYMNKGTYTKELEMDYPSTNIINKLALDQQTTIIFVTDNTISSYDALKTVISGIHVIYSTITARKKESIESKLVNTFKNITEILKLKVNMDPIYAKNINMNIEPDCDKLECNIEYNKKQIFKANITVLDVFDAKKTTIDISVNGIQEKLTLDIKLLNECNCKPGNETYCSDGGVQRCGVCECHDNRSGIRCECSQINTDANLDKSTCIMSNSTIECNGHGSCICGSCICGEKRYRGRFCECDDKGCPKDKNGRLCGHGNCLCGKCSCEKGWQLNMQRTCNCESSKEQCQTGLHECSNNGKCECNKCICSANICEWDARSILGLRCNPLPCHDCHRRQCNLLEPYALRLNDHSTLCGKRVNVTLVKKLDNETTWKVCSDIRSDVGCYTNFIYKYDEEKYGVHLIVQSEHNCAESAYIYGGVCLGGLILIGILTLVCWKVLSVRRDRKEYRRFFKQHQESLKVRPAQHNPLFNSANKTIMNPAFRRKSIFS